MVRRIILSIVFVAIASFGIVMPSTSPALAATPQNCGGGDGIRVLGLPTWYKYLNPRFVPAQGSKPAECKIDFDITKDAGKVLLAVVEIMLRIGGLVAVGFIIYGGFRYILSQGEPDKAKSARQTIINALVGLIIAIMAVAVVNLISGSLIT